MLITTARKRGRYGHRDATMILLAYRHGLRVFELVGFTWDQVDFGQGAFLELGGGKRRRPHVFRVVLSYSRKGYSEVVLRQTTDAFLMCLENAFWHFGGVPRRIVLDTT